MAYRLTTEAAEAIRKTLEALGQLDPDLTSKGVKKLIFKTTKALNYSGVQYWLVEHGMGRGFDSDTLSKLLNSDRRSDNYGVEDEDYLPDLVGAVNALLEQCSNKDGGKLGQKLEAAGVKCLSFNEKELYEIIDSGGSAISVGPSSKRSKSKAPLLFQLPPSPTNFLQRPGLFEIAYRLTTEAAEAIRKTLETLGQLDPDLTSKGVKKLIFKTTKALNYSGVQYWLVEHGMGRGFDSDTLSKLLNPDRRNDNYGVKDADYLPDLVNAVNALLDQCSKKDGGKLGQKLEAAGVKRLSFSNEELYEVIDSDGNSIIVPSFSKKSKPKASLFQVPPLPTHFVERPEPFEKVKTLMLPDRQSGTLVVSAIKGMGGIGKSVLAAALARDEDVRERFKDGVLWVTLGQNPEPRTLLENWIRTGLEDYNYKPSSTEVASRHLSTLLRNKRMLLVIDDVWKESDAEPFLVGGEHCCVLVTTRKAELRGVVSYRLDVMSETEAREMLGRTFSEDTSAMDREAAIEFAKVAGYLPLALTLAVSLAKKNRMSWQQVLKDFKEESKSLDRNDSDEPNNFQDREPISVPKKHSSVEQVLKELTSRVDIQSEPIFDSQSIETEENAYESSGFGDLISDTSEFIVKAVIRPPEKKITIGEEIAIFVSLSLENTNLADDNSSDIDSREIFILEVDTNTQLLEINIFLDAPGFEFIGEDTSSLVFDASSLYHLQESPLSQETSFKLMALVSGTSTIHSDIYLGTLFKGTLEREIEVEPLINAEFRRPFRNFLARSIPHSDLAIQINTHFEISENKSASFVFHYQIDGFHPSLLFIEKDKYDSQPIAANFLERALGLIKEKLRNGTASPYFKPSLISIGNYLYKHLIPTDLQEVLNSIYRLKTNFNILVLTNQYDYFPWEILHNGQHFLGERFTIGRWLLESNRTRPYEFPLGLINLGHYARVKKPVKWLEVLEVSEAPFPSLLSHGTIAELTSIEPMRGLHLLRMGESEICIEEHDDTPVLLDSNESNQDLEEEVRDIKLSLKRNRPLISLGYLNAGQAEWTNLTSTWASTFIRAGCSAFIGPLWAVQPQVEAAFVSTFYSRLWAGKPLGESFWAARQMARVAVPDSMDWLAYVLFGDPMARPYRPVEGQGYAIVEPVGQDIDQPVMPGAQVRFRASLRRKPPIWYENRLMDVAETLEFDQLKIYVVTSELQVEPGECIDMTKTPGGDYLGWFTLTVPVELAGRSALVQVHFEDGMEPIHSLRFAVQVAAADGGAA